MERLVGTLLQTGWDAFTQSCAESPGQEEGCHLLPPAPCKSPCRKVQGCMGGAGWEAHPSGKGRQWRKEDGQTPRAPPPSSGLLSTLLRNKIDLKKAGTEVKPK